MTGRQDLFEESMQLGHSAAWDLDWAKAAEFYRKALAEFPENPGALTSLALALLEIGELKEALATYHKATKFRPDDPMPVEKCAEIFELLGQHSEAVKQRSQAATLHIQQKNAEKALDNWVHIARMVPANLSARSRLAMTFERLNRRRPAVHEYLAMASILQGRGSVEQALETIRKALALSPGDAAASEALRTLQEGRPLARPAIPLGATPPSRLRRAAQLPVGPPEQLESRSSEELDPEEAAQRLAISTLAGMVFEDVQDAEEGPGGDTRPAASPHGRRAGLASVGRPRKYRYLSEAIELQTRGHVAEAAREMKRALEAGLSHPAAHLNLGLLHKRLGELDEARQQLELALNDPELSLGASLAIGRISKSMGDIPEAAEHLLQALKLADGMSLDASQSSQLDELYGEIKAPEEEQSREGLARIVDNTLAFLSGPDWKKRVRQARERLSIHEESSTLVPLAEMLTVGGSEKIFQALSRIDSLVSAGKLTTAMEEAMLALDEAPDYLPLHLRMAEIMLEGGRSKEGMEKVEYVAETYRTRGEVDKAIHSFLRAIEVSPINLKARSRVIGLLTQQKRWKEALTQYLELAGLLRQMAQIDEARQSLEEAYKIAEKVDASSEQRVRILQEMADIDISQLNWPRALGVLEQVLALQPDDLDSLAKLTDLSLRLGRDQSAMKHLDKYLEALVQGRRNVEALQFLEEKTREHPDRQGLRVRLGKAYQAAGRKEEAVSQYDALGELQMEAGQLQEAQSTIRKIISLEPPEIDGYRQLLAELEKGSRSAGGG